jgi:hypothetical protein
LSSVPDPGSGIGCLFDTGSGIRYGRISASGSGIRDEQPGSYFLELRNHFFAFLGVKILKFFDEDPGSGMETVRIRDGKKSDCHTDFEFDFFINLETKNCKNYHLMYRGTY